MKLVKWHEWVSIAIVLPMLALAPVAPKSFWHYLWRFLQQL